jgi:hypothetical protein
MLRMFKADSPDRFGSPDVYEPQYPNRLTVGVESLSMNLPYKK